MTQLEQLRALVNELNEASKAYYNTGRTLMSDAEYDAKLDQLKELEEETEITYPDSPTVNVGYKVLDEQKEVRHNHLMLSLDKCHSEEELMKFAGNQDCILSVKCDGLTTSLRYMDGKLVSAETRGDGVSGMDVLENVKTIKNIPLTIPYKDELIIDGETIIDWNTFRDINDNLPQGVEKYKHPRNLVSGSLGLLDSSSAEKRNMRWIAWRVIKGLNEKSVFFALKEAEKLGFEVVPMWTYSNHSSDKENLSVMLSNLQDKADEKGIPYDGAVMAIDNIQYGESLGRTDKFFRHSIAYKYEDELYKTHLIEIEYNTSKSGLINPVAVFEPTIIDGASIERATLHNLSYIENLQLGYGDEILIYKSNKIIPKVHSNNTRSNTWTYPQTCPCCGAPTEVRNDNGSKMLYCTGTNCKAQLLGKLTHAVSRNALNIDNLSEATLETFINRGWLNSIQDIYHLSDHKKEMTALPGFGIKSVNKLLEAIEKSRNVTLDRFLYSLSVPLLGKTASKAISKFCEGDESVFIELLADPIVFKKIDGIGDKLIENLEDLWFDSREYLFDLLEEFNFEKENTDTPQTVHTVSGQTFCITGKVVHFANRDAFVAAVEAHGGKYLSGVSAKLDWLINNDVASTSGKNKKMHELGKADHIISEEQFLKMIGE